MWQQGYSESIFTLIVVFLVGAVAVVVYICERKEKISMNLSQLKFHIVFCAH